MGLGRQAGFQSHFDRALHRLLIMLQDQRQDFGHYPIAAKGAAWPPAARFLPVGYAPQAPLLETPHRSPRNRTSGSWRWNDRLVGRT